MVSIVRDLTLKLENYLNTNEIILISRSRKEKIKGNF